MARPTILVTGGAGYIGSHTVVDLVENGYAPVLVDDFSNSERSALRGIRELCREEVTCHEVDCADRDAMRAVFEASGPLAGVIHFAASKAVGESQREPLRYYRNNVDGLLSLLELMGEFGCRDLVFSSSCVVYGQPEQLPVTERSALGRAESVYGATKQICERVIEDVVRSGVPLRATLLRYFNPIGAHPSALIGELPIGVPQNLVPVILQSAAGLRGPVEVYGGDWSTPDGSCIRDYIHVMDLAAAHVAALEWLAKRPESALSRVFNLGTGRGVSVREAIDAFERATGEKLDWQLAERRPGDIEQIYANADEARRELGWSAERSIEDAMQDAWKWQQTLPR